MVRERLKKIFINGEEVEPVEKIKFHEEMSPSEIEKLIKQKQIELGIIKEVKDGD